MRILIVLLTCLLTLPAYAQDYQTVLDIPAGHTLVNLSATERQSVSQDLLIAHLRYETINEDATTLQNDVNQKMTAALEKAKSYKDVKASTQSYTVYAQEENTGRPGETRRIWAGQQGLELKSTKADSLLKLTGELQAMGLAMSDLSYTVSPETLEETQSAMLEAALQKLQGKADRTAKALGKSKSELLQVNVDSGGFYPMPVMMRSMAKMEMASDLAAPVAQAGESDITLTVNAQALLKP
ncbi:MAG: SIMPL domain-containing protein [Alphaproteobacteria bacterium]|nr:SIMPL domain-containing protein [Alphaproteobacteria bacterium]